MVACTLDIGPRRVLVSEEGPPAAEFALFDASDIELAPGEGGGLRESGYRTTAADAVRRLAVAGVTLDFANECAEIARGRVGAAYARGRLVRRLVPLLGPGELFDGGTYDATLRRYAGTWLDLSLLANDAGVTSATGVLHAASLTVLLSEVAGGTPVVLTTLGHAESLRLGERTLRRQAVDNVAAVLRALKQLAENAPAPRETEGPGREELSKIVTERLAWCANTEAREHLLSLERALVERKRPASGPLSDPELWEAESMLGQGEITAVVRRLDAREARSGREPATIYLRARAALLHGRESPRAIAQRIAEMALSMSDFHELELLAAQAWNAAGEPRSALPFARDLATNPRVPDDIRAAAEAILRAPRAATPAPLPGDHQIELETDARIPPSERPPPVGRSATGSRPDATGRTPPSDRPHSAGQGATGSRPDLTARVPPSERPPSVGPVASGAGAARSEKLPSVFPAPLASAGPRPPFDAPRSATPVASSPIASSPIASSPTASSPTASSPIASSSIVSSPIANSVPPPQVVVHDSRTDLPLSRTPSERPRPRTLTPPAVTPAPNPTLQMPQARRYLTPPERVASPLPPRSRPADFDDASGFPPEPPTPRAARGTPSPPARPPSDPPTVPRPSARVVQPAQWPSALRAPREEIMRPEEIERTPSRGPSPRYMRGASLPPLASEPPLAIPRAPVVPRVDIDEAELLETIPLPRGATDLAVDSTALPRTPLEARSRFTNETRELARRYRREDGVELRLELRTISAVQRHLLHRFPSRAVKTTEDAREAELHGALLSEVLIRLLDAEWADIAPSELGYWAMVVPLRGGGAKRVWPFGRVLRFIAGGSNGSGEDDLVAFFRRLREL